MQKYTERKGGKNPYAFFWSNQVALSVINLTYYTMMVGNLLRKAEAGLRKGNTAVPSHIYKNKSKLILFFFLPWVPHFLTVLRLTTSLSKCVAGLCTQNNTLWLHSLVGLDKAFAEFLMQSIIVLLWYWLIHCKMGRRCSHRLEIPCLSLQIVPLSRIYVTEMGRSEAEFTGILEM